MEKVTEKKHLPELLHAAVRQFRSGEDAAGMEDLRKAVDELEAAVEADQESLQFSMDKLLPALRELYGYMQNRDIAGLTDWLEYTAATMPEECPEGCGEL
ncbi:MAG TPA: hypothetical protein VHR42_05065 [Clostridia bacterium]|nr:hypothetical protein [Clostridia bacterium]